jgi:predicted permease
MRLASRSLVRRPGYLLVAGGILLVGLTQTLMMFGAVDSMALRPLPFAEADRLVTIDLTAPDRGWERAPVGVHDFLDLQARQESFEEMAGLYTGTVNVTHRDSPERFDGAFVTANLFGALGVAPMLGRDFVPADNLAGAAPVVMVGHELWRTRLGGSPDLVGSMLRVNGRPATVIGIMPPRFSFPVYEQVWVPVSLDAGSVRRGEATGLMVVARLGAEATESGAASEMEVVSAELARLYPETNRGVVAQVRPLIERWVDPGMRTTLYTMLAVSVLVLLIACANVANLTLLRAASRSRELAVRAALGAGRHRLVGEIAAESVVVSGLAVALAMPLARILGQWALDVYRAGGMRLPFWVTVGSDWRTSLFTGVAVLVSVLVGGIVPAWRASAGDLTSNLRSGGRGIAGNPMGRLSRWMVSAEVTLGVVVLVCAGLMVRSVVSMQRVDFGVDTRAVLTGRIGLFAGSYPLESDCARLVRELVGKLAELPGVTAATATTGLPGMGAEGVWLDVEGRETPPGERPELANRVAVEPGYFRTFGVTPAAGRDLASGDGPDAPRVAVVSAQLARRIVPDGQVVGRRLRFREFVQGEKVEPWLEIVGVAPDIHQDAVNDQPRPTVYVPFAQQPRRFVSLALRTAGPPQALAASLRRTVAALDPDLPVYWLEPLDARIAESRFLSGYLASFFSIFAGIGLVLAAVGLYAVLAYEVAQQTAEIGVRRALGAGGRRLLGEVVGRHARRFGVAVALGLAIAVVFSRFLSVVLYGIEPFDLATFAAATTVVLGACSLAGLLPSLRALRIEPATALRTE